MKTRFAFFIVCGLALLLPFHAMGEQRSARGCEKKVQILEEKLRIAKSRNNPGQIRGLERALEKTRMYCADGSLRNRLDDKVAEKREEVRERELELIEAKKEGKSAEKIAKRERKLAEAREELREAEEERELLR